MPTPSPHAFLLLNIEKRGIPTPPQVIVACFCAHAVLYLKERSMFKLPQATVSCGRVLFACFFFAPPF